MQALKRSFCGANNLDATIRTREDKRVRVEATFELHNAVPRARTEFVPEISLSQRNRARKRAEETDFFCHQGIRTIDHAHAKQGSNHQANGEL